VTIDRLNVIGEAATRVLDKPIMRKDRFDPLVRAVGDNLLRQIALADQLGAMARDGLDTTAGVVALKDSIARVALGCMAIARKARNV